MEWIDEPISAPRPLSPETRTSEAKRRRIVSLPSSSISGGAPFGLAVLGLLGWPASAPADPLLDGSMESKPLRSKRKHLIAKPKTAGAES
nr:unnamed protein product [Digitaria exilis]